VRRAVPVDIDFGDVTMAMRDLLRRMGKKRFKTGLGGVDVVPQRDAAGNDQAGAQS